MAKALKKSIEKTPVKADTQTKDYPTPTTLSPGFVLTIQGLFVGSLKDTYWAENHLVAAIPKMIAAAGTSDLKAALEEHLELTKEHVKRLEQVFALLGENIAAKKCDAMEGLTISGEHIIENTVSGSPVRDLGIIMAALKVENFEITDYKGLIELAGKLEKDEVSDLLQQTLEEEIEASDALNSLSAAIAVPSAM